MGRFLGSGRPLGALKPSKNVGVPLGLNRASGFLLGLASCPAVLNTFLDWVPEGSLAGILWVGFWGLGGPLGL